MDKSVVPGDDFYNYANGTWMKNAEIPADRSRSAAFSDRRQGARKEHARAVRRNPEVQPGGRHRRGRIANYYKAYVDTDGDRPRRAWRRPRPISTRSRGSPTRAQLSAAIGRTLRADTDPLNATNFQTENLFGVFVTQGLATPGEQLPYLMQGGIGLPEREYYLSSDSEMAELRDKYRAYVATDPEARRLAPTPQARGADGSSALETKIAQAHETREESEDFAKGAQVVDAAPTSSKKAPGIDWAALLNAAQLGNAQKFEAYQRGCDPEARRAGRLAAAADAGRTGWRSTGSTSRRTCCPRPFRDASFAFYGTALAGTPQQRPRDKRALNATSNALQDAVGKAYVDKYFPASAKAEIQTMVDEHQGRVRQRVEAIEWMAPSTKAEALKKVADHRRRRRLSRHLARLFAA